MGLAPLTLADLITHVRNLLNDNANYIVTDPTLTSAQTWGDDLIIDALNWAQKEFMKTTGLSYKELACTTSPATCYFTIPGSSTYIEIWNLFGSDNKKLFKTTVPRESSQFPDWKANLGYNRTPIRYMVPDGNTIVTLPGMPSATHYPTIGILDAPSYMSATSDNSTVYVDSRIPPAFHEPLKYGAAFWLLSLKSDNMNLALGQKHLEVFKSLIAELTR